jgi:hypothetical protein
MANFPEGDTVRVLPFGKLREQADPASPDHKLWLATDKTYFIEQMQRYCGNILTIKKIYHNGHYHVAEAGYSWLNNMFESLPAIPAYEYW